MQKCIFMILSFAVVAFATPSNTSNIEASVAKIAQDMAQERYLSLFNNDWEEYIALKESIKEKKKLNATIKNICDMAKDLYGGSKCATYSYLALFISTHQNGIEYLDMTKIQKLFGLQYQVREFYQQGANTLYVIKFSNAFKDFYDNFQFTDSIKESFEKILYDYDKKLFEDYEQGDYNKSELIEVVAFLQFKKIPLTKESFSQYWEVFRNYGDRLIGDLFQTFIPFRMRYGEKQSNATTSDFDIAKYFESKYFESMGKEYEYIRTYYKSCYDYFLYEDNVEYMKHTVITKKATPELNNPVCKAFYDSFEWAVGKSLSDYQAITK
ncbi:hypothetical protein [Helicobacter sp. 23-1046]